MKHPHAIALRAGDRSFSYQELDRHANALAAELQRAGVGRETLVGVCAERRAELVVAILAVLKSGAAYVPIDPKYPKDRISYILQDASAPILLTQRSLADTLPATSKASASSSMMSCNTPRTARHPTPARKTSPM